MKILFTGFEPFGKMDKNPSWELAEWVKQEKFPGADVRAEGLPVIFQTCAHKALDIIKSWNPDVVLHFGVAAGRQTINIEQTAVNIEHAPDTPDNAGDAPADRYIDSGGPDGIFATIPVRNLTENLQEAGIPAEVSYSAGTYICNSTLYRVLRFINDQELSVKAGFIHVPVTPDMASGSSLPSMDLEVQKRAVTQLIATLVKEEENRD
ncbi:peptidase C15 [Alkalicoccus halolimnae]|uniref:Pyroglutamyl-peptidase I n=1 Tax=Alkalicoccus halolimnae TaxID=1667239 RepID=A0A5C7FF00_9BACI|nr:peptidase C15 [Alkalicoccus halolimnae]TXF85877.1 peptidase C15 [Alkalicoccus halolimnae]